MRGVLLRSLSWRFTKTLLAMLSAVTALAFLIDFFSFAGRASRLPGYSIASGMLLSLTHMPTTVEAIVPFIAQFATVALLVRLAGARELVIFRGAGLSAYQFTAPLCVIAVLVGILSICTLDPLAARSIAWSRAVEDRISGTQNATPLGEKPPVWIKSSSGTDMVVLGARVQRNQGLDLRDVTFIRIDAGSITESLNARSAALVDDHLVFHDVTRSRIDEQPRQLASLSIPSVFSEEAFRDQFGDPREISFFDLPAAISSAQQAGLAAIPLKMRFFSLLALPLLLAAMVLISTPISVRFERSGHSAPMVISTVLAGYAVYAGSALVSALALAGRLSPALAASLPVIVGGGAALYWILTTEDG